MKGIWKGYYEYGPGYQLPMFGTRVNIEFNLEEVDDGFEGHCVEEESSFSISEVSKISGFEQEGMISFVKKLENSHEFSEDGSSKIIEGVPSEVIYQGQYDEQRDSMFGLWQINESVLTDDGERLEYVVSGMWIVKREK